MTTQGERLVSFEAEGSTLTVRDTVMESSCAFTASGSPDPIRVSTGRFLFPVDAAVSVETEALTLPENAGIYVRAEDGEMLGFPSESATEYPRGTYYVEISSYCKLYLKVFDTEFDISMERHNGWGAARIEFAEPTRVALGARSRHERPVGTITVPDEPGALREVLPYLASGVKEWSCERSWPTLRGHPPRVERGDALGIPSHLSKPDTGVTLAVPETYEALYTVAPLAYYLGADVVTGAEPELRLDNGYTERLAQHGDTLSDAARSLLRRCLFLDSLVRGEGYTSIPLKEYEEVAGELPFYPPELYERTIPEQLIEYLEVDDGVIEGYLDQLPYDAVLRDDPADAPLLPYLLAFPTPIRVGATESDVGSVCVGHSAGPVPDGATRLSVAGFEHTLERPIRPVSEERVVLLGVDAGVTEALSDVLLGERHRDVREPFDLTTRAPTRSNVRDALSDDCGFVHVDAPLTSRGFVCVDGILDPATLTDVSARVVSVVGTPDDVAGTLDSFVERGARVASISSLLPGRTLGQIVGRLLSGAPIAKAVQWADFGGASARQRFIGNAAACLVSVEGMRLVHELAFESLGLDEHRLTVYTWGGPTARQVGSASAIESPYLTDEHRLSGQGLEQPGTLTSAEVADLCNEKEFVYVLNGEVYQHERELTVEDVRESARRALADPDADRPRGGD